MANKEYHTASKGEPTKINLEGCKECGKVYVSFYSAMRLQKLPGWYLLANLQQTHQGDRDQNVVIRVRGRRWGHFRSTGLPRLQSEKSSINILFSFCNFFRESSLFQMKRSSIFFFVNHWKANNIFTFVTNQIFFIIYFLKVY